MQRCWRGCSQRHKADLPSRVRHDRIRGPGHLTVGWDDSDGPARSAVLCACYLDVVVRTVVLRLNRKGYHLCWHRGQAGDDTCLVWAVFCRRVARGLDAVARQDARAGHGDH
eukprot:3195548-Prymnesium_polylepis.1